MSSVGPRPALYDQDDLITLRTQEGVVQNKSIIFPHQTLDLVVRSIGKHIQTPIKGIVAKL